MSSKNVEVVRKIYEVWTGEGSDEALKLIAEDLEYVNPPYAVHPGTRRGRDGWMAAAANLDDSFESWCHEPGEIIDVGDKVVAITTFRARGRGSAMELEKFEPHVWTLRDGKVIRFEWFNDRDEALQAAGLADR